MYPSQTEQNAHHFLNQISENNDFCDFLVLLPQSHLDQIASQNEKKSVIFWSDLGTPKIS